MIRWRKLLAYFARPLHFSANARLYLVGTFVMGLGHGAVWVHMNLYYRALGLGEGTIGRLLSLGALGTLLAALPAARLADRWSAQRLFALASLGYGACIGVQLLFPHTIVLALASCATGLLFTVHWVAAAPFFMRNSTAGDRVYLFGFAQALETIATIVAALGVGAAVRWLTPRFESEVLAYRWSLGAIALLSLAALFPFARIRSGPSPAPAKRWWEYVRTRQPRMVWQLLVTHGLIGLGAGLVIPFLNLYFRDRFHQGPQEIGMYFAVSQAFTVVGFLLAAPIARRLGAPATVCWTQLLSIPFFLGLAFAPILWVAVFAFWMRGALMNMNTPVLNAFAMEQVQADEQAATNSLRSLVWSGAWVISTQVGGGIIERYGFAPPMLIAITLYAASTLLFHVFFGTTRKARALGSPA